MSLLASRWPRRAPPSRLRSPPPPTSLRGALLVSAPSHGPEPLSAAPGTPTCGGSEAPGRARARVPRSSAYTRAGGCGTHGANLLARRAPAPPAEESSRGFCLCLPPLWCPHGSSSSPPRPPRASPFLTRPPPRRVPPGASHRRRGNTLAAAALTRASSRAAVLP
ncbi:unnamed protein product [Prorocentrum cordatum]|uniref:Uncharacterized protein n=1 Tax=Prorocentrum cordatum TaxID=2364126 RepID=A0ABN9WFR9_9DINO|nr:unnamed protein product [Polarella glacialis]